MVTTQETIRKTGDFIRNSATLKVFSIALLVLILLIPEAMVSSLLKEREFRRDSVVQEINRKWGNSQTITGPFFTVPYKNFYKDEKGNLKFDIQYFHFLPENLDITGKLDTQRRYRGLYETILYNCRIKVMGNFSKPALSQSDIDPDDVIWNKAILSIGITDLKGIRDNIEITYNRKKYKAEPGLITADIASSGIHCFIPISPDNEENAFSFEVNLNGSEQIQFIPVGETTIVSLESGWPSPSFNGSFLPTGRKITDEGFSATWNILHLNRNFPQFWSGNQYNVYNASFGLKLLVTADVYQKSTRISKYAIMFIAFTFAAFFLSEIINKKRVHPIQYLLIGLSVILFYVLLLSISEHTNFNFAYLVSALAITVTISGYSKGILKNWPFTATVFGILTILYTYLYLVLQLEDYALIMGAIGLVLVLSTVMYITRKVDWYSIERTKNKP
jgi:inner membrane protein